MYLCKIKVLNKKKKFQNILENLLYQYICYHYSVFYSIELQWKKHLYLFPKGYKIKNNICKDMYIYIYKIYHLRKCYSNESNILYDRDLEINRTSTYKAIYEKYKAIV